MTLATVHRLVSVPSLLLLALAAPAAAQFAPGGPGEKDLPVDAATRRAVVDTLADRLERFYVFADRGREYARAMQQHVRRGRYEGVTSSMAFADTITKDLQALSKDLHLRLHYRFDPLPANENDDAPDPGEARRQLEFERVRNFGFEKVQRLAGNVGYLDLRMFSGRAEAMPTAVAAMNFLGHCDAVIVDLRRNGGGSPAMIDLLLTYFTEPGEMKLLNRFYQRETDRLSDFTTLPYVPGPNLHGRPLYVLTSGRTGSAAEEFAYNVKTHQYGRTVGQVSGGAAHPGRLFRLADHFAAFVATGRAVNPVTNTNWEGVGVSPDIEAPVADAIKVAHAHALEAMMADATDPERKEMLGRALQAAKEAAPDPMDDPRANRRPAGQAPRR